MSETVSERRLRELADVMLDSWTCEGASNQPDLDAMRHGAEALKLWRDYCSASTHEARTQAAYAAYTLIAQADTE